jgi:ABC-type Fe3+-hydroxamate transport system substrate-binding protein
MQRRLSIFALLVPALLIAAGPKPQRIVSVSPAITELLYGIGAFDRIVAVTEFCLYPPAARSLPKVGGWSTPSVERVVSFRPDLVAISDAQGPFLKEPLTKLGTHIEVVKSQTIDDAFQAMAELGKATGNERQAADLAARTRTELETVRRRAASLPRPSVLAIVDRTPGTLRDLYAVTPGSFLAELIEIAGGKLVVGSTRAGYGRISKETVLAQNPDIIFDIMPASQSSIGPHPESAWGELPEINAVRHGQVHVIRDDFVPHDSQMIGRTAALFAHLLHPEVPEREWEPR